MPLLGVHISRDAKGIALIPYFRQNLHQLIYDKEAPLTLKEALHFLSDVGRAVNLLHSVGVIHGHIHPGECLL